jgi:hypothetical protein
MIVFLAAMPLGSKLSDITPPIRFLLLAAVFSFAGMLLPTYFMPHYAAPITALLYALVLSMMRYMRSFCMNEKPVGLGMTRAALACCVLITAIRVSAPVFGIALAPYWSPENCRFPERAAIIAELDRRAGRHLVFAEHPSDKNLDWVYNAADIDASKIVWARDLGPAKNRELIDYYKGRRTVWIVDPAERQPRLRPYVAAPAGTTRTAGVS